MKFSIITITKNSEKFLDETLQSVAEQESVEFEHILWDGGSSDRTLDIASSFSHLSIHQGQDEGISDAMNRGAAMAKGDFLLHLHSDDRLAHPRVLSMIATALKQHPNAEWLYGRANIIDEKGNLLYMTPYERYAQKRLRKYNFITHPATFVSRQLFEKVEGFRAKLKYCMDYDLWLRLSHLTTPYVISSVIASFRQHSDSLSTSRPLKVANEAYHVRNQYVKTVWERYRSYKTMKRRCKNFEN